MSVESFKRRMYRDKRERIVELFRKEFKLWTKLSVLPIKHRESIQKYIERNMKYYSNEVEYAKRELYRVLDKV